MLEIIKDEKNIIYAEKFTFRLAFSVGTNEHILWTCTDDRTNWQGVLYSTRLSWMAGAGETGILAFALITGVARRAIGVHATFSLHRRWRPDAGHVGVSPGSGVTAAGRLVVPG